VRAFLTPWIYNIHASLDLPMAERLGKLSFLASFSHVSWTPAKTLADLGHS
jgi:iron complex outermembrane receptor protein